MLRSRHRHKAATLTGTSSGACLLLLLLWWGLGQPPHERSAAAFSVHRALRSRRPTAQQLHQPSPALTSRALAGSCSQRWRWQRRRPPRHGGARAPSSSTAWGPSSASSCGASWASSTSVRPTTSGEPPTPAAAAAACDAGCARALRCRCAREAVKPNLGMHGMSTQPVACQCCELFPPPRRRDKPACPLPASVTVPSLTIRLVAHDCVSGCRCIKPNPESKPGSLSPSYALEQLRAGGVLEAVRIASAGFPTRKAFRWELATSVQMPTRAPARQPLPSQLSGAQEGPACRVWHLPKPQTPDRRPLQLSTCTCTSVQSALCGEACCRRGALQACSSGSRGDCGPSPAGRDEMPRHSSWGSAEG